MKYVPAFDGLRAVAVFMVVFFHLHTSKLPGGWIAVDVFFVLSGYLITRILDAENSSHHKIDLMRFYRNRVLRLAPALLLVLVSVACLTPYLNWPAMDNFKSILLALFYMTNWSMAFGWWPEGALFHTWSLSVEEQFYFVWPLLFAMTPRKALPVLTALIIATSLVWQTYLASTGVSIYRVALGSDTRCISILFGCLIALVNSNRFNERIARFWLVPVLGLFLVAATHDHYQFSSVTLSTVGASLLAGWLLLAIPYAKPVGYFLSLPILVYFGRISYGIYLWHQVIISLLTGRIAHDSMAGKIAVDSIVILGAILLSAASFKYLELPSLSLKEKFQRPPRPKSIHMNATGQI